MPPYDDDPGIFVLHGFPLQTVEMEGLNTPKVNQPPLDPKPRIVLYQNVINKILSHLLGIWWETPFVSWHSGSN
ncbi:hypothetical protein I7I53_09663 [Histoplasma capsulatum var. duboisii H88]|uniref:Uncharacterized protein n=1 Tax=Ajellomyces capsulatus (strain H88) TaxID=544711 RepID=A0A8A1L6U0_AJEC8|nr:hypothetical protein I7I53_09663 [Histoplasma capsulatum var. duboisii H88]